MLHRSHPAPRWPYLKVSNDTKRLVKRKFNKKRREICQRGLKEIKCQFNNGVPIDKLNTDMIIKDNRYIKVKSRDGLGDYIEKRCRGGRLTIGLYL